MYVVSCSLACFMLPFLQLRCKEFDYHILRSLSTSTSTPQKSVYVVDDDTESNSTGRSGNHSPSVNKYTNRTHTCGELNINHEGQKVTLCGWLEYQRMNKFIVLRDSYGETQLVITDTVKTVVCFLATTASWFFRINKFKVVLIKSLMRVLFRLKAL